MNVALFQPPDDRTEIDQVGGTGSSPTRGTSWSVSPVRITNAPMRCVGNKLPCQLLLLLAVTNLAFATGCGQRHPPTYPVSGKVVFADGVSLTTGGVVLCNSIVDGGQSISARGSIHGDGTFTLTTYSDGDGAVAGKHRVLVRAKRDVDDFVVRGIIPLPVIDRRFESYQTSGLEFTVEDRNNEWRLVVERPPGR